MEIDHQQRAAQQLEEYFAQNKVGILAGVSGLGKSTVATKVAELLGLTLHQAVVPSFSHDPIHIDAPPNSLVVIESDRSRGLWQILKKAREELEKVLVLSNRTQSDEYKETPELVVRLEPLNPGQIAAFATSIDAEITPAEILLLQKYSMGVPRLLEQMMKHRPIQEHQAVPLLKAYILELIDTHRLGGKGVIEEFLFQELSVTLPAELEVDALSEGNFRNEWKRYFYRLAKLNEPYAMPRCPETFGHYEDWFERLQHGNAFHNATAVFAPDTGGKLQKLGEILGTPASNFGEGRLSRCETHKTWWFHSGEAFGGEGKEYAQEHLDSWLKLAAMDVHSASTTPLFFLTSCDHFDRFRQPFYAAYNAELVLQGLEIGYYISHSGKGYYYDPGKNQYRAITQEEWDRVKIGS